MVGKLKIRKKTLDHFIMFFLLMLPSFQMLGFDMKFLGNGTPSYIRILSLASFIISICLYVAKKLYKKKDMPILLYTLVCFIISIYFYIKNGNVSFSAMLAYISVFYIVIVFVRIDGYLALDYIYYFFSFYWIIELLAIVTPIKNSFSSVTYTFIGHIQIYSMMWVTYVVISLIRARVFGRSISTIWQVVFLAIATFLTCLSGTSISKVAIIVMGILPILFKDKHNNTNKILLIAFVIAIVLNIGVVFLNYQERFLSIISLLGEDSSLNGRTYIWSLFIPEIIKSPIIGSGYKALGVDLSLWGPGRTGMNYCHNTILQELANGGIIQVTCFMILNIITIQKIKKIESNTIRIFAFCAMVAMYLIMISESVTYFCYFNLIIAVVENLDLIEFKS